MRLLVILLALQGCAFDVTKPFVIAYPQVGHRYGHTYYEIQLKGTVR